MIPSQTVENYLKTIFLAQAADPSSKALVPMGQIAGALGVVPGTATTMIKTLAESGLVRYEPYMGVRLTPAGEKLAGLVIRRHRLIELFLVKVLNMSWMRAQPRRPCSCVRAGREGDGLRLKNSRWLPGRRSPTSQTKT